MRTLSGICFSLYVIPSSARPNPRFHHESSLHRIPLDIPQNLPILIRTPNPMIVGFPLPERQPGALQQLVGPPRRHAFDRLHAYRRSHNRLDQQMNMVAHHQEPADFTPPFIMLRRPEYNHHRIRHAWVLSLFRQRLTPRLRGEYDRYHTDQVNRRQRNRRGTERTSHACVLKGHG